MSSKKPPSPPGNAAKSPQRLDANAAKSADFDAPAASSSASCRRPGDVFECSSGSSDYEEPVAADADKEPLIRSISEGAGAPPPRRRTFDLGRRQNRRDAAPGVAHYDSEVGGGGGGGAHGVSGFVKRLRSLGHRNQQQKPPANVERRKKHSEFHPFPDALDDVFRGRPPAIPDFLSETQIQPEHREEPIPTSSSSSLFDRFNHYHNQPQPDYFDDDDYVGAYTDFLVPAPLPEKKTKKKTMEEPHGIPNHNRAFFLLYICLGGEMIYILDGRLRLSFHADRDKATRVLQDMIICMYDEGHCQAVLDAAEIPVHDNLFKIFETVSKSTSMMLSSNSTIKLFDIMCVMVKFQLLNLVIPEQLPEVAANHLLELKNMYGSDKGVSDVLDRTFEKLKEVMEPLNGAEHWMARAEMLAFLQDERTRLSVLITKAAQSPTDGHIYLFKKGDSIKITLEIERPGAVKYHTKTESESYIWNVKRDFICIPCEPHLRVLRNGEFTTDLGLNNFTEGPATVHGAAGAHRRTAANNDEINLLGTLLGATPAPAGENVNYVALSMFDNDNEETKYASETKQAMESVAKINEANAQAATEKRKTMAQAIDELRLGTAEPRMRKTKGADLLDMFDEAANRPPTAAARRTTSVRQRTAGGSSGGGGRPTTRSSSNPRLRQQPLMTSAYR